MAKTMDFYFFYGSIHSYLSVMRIEGLASLAGVEVCWRPFNLREILIEQNNTGFVKNPVKMDYFWRDVERRAVRDKIPFVGRAPYPADPDLLALRVGLIAAEENWCAEYSRATFHEWFIGQRAPGVADHVERVLVSLGKSPEPIIMKATETSTDVLLRQATGAARGLGIFGAPTFTIGHEIFWGDDRLGDALNCASGQRRERSVVKHFLLEGEHVVPFEQRAPELIAAHRQFLQKCYESGRFLLSGPSVPPKGGILIARAESLDELNEFLADEPYCKAGVMRFSKIIEFEPVQHQPFLTDWFGNQ